MDYRKALYKHSKVHLAEELRARRSERLSYARLEGRMKILEGKRNIFLDSIEISTKVLPPPEPIKDDKNKKKSRAEMLQQWKQEKQKRIEELKKKQKPVFKVGVVHRKATGSPLTTVTNTYANKNFLRPQQINKVSKPEVNGALTRARAKLQGIHMTPPKPAPSAFLKIDKNKKKQIKQHKFVLPKAVSELPYSQRITIPSSPQITKSSRKNKKPVEAEPQINLNATVVLEQNKVAEQKVKEMEVSGVKDGVKVMEQKVKEMEVSSSNDEPKKLENTEVEEIETRMKNLKSDDEVSSSGDKTDSTEYVPIHYSPFVNKVRGSAKKSPKNPKISLTMDVNLQIEKEENEFKCRIFSFRKFVECQTKRLLGMCDEWKQFLKENPEIPEDVIGEINCVVGKTNLLTSDKFKQFKDIIEKCDQKDPMIKIDDLQGFQDWVSIEVDNIDEVFAKLEERKKNNWKDKLKPQKIVAKVENKVENKENKNPPKQPVGKSNIRAHIMAARKLMRQNAIDLSPLKTLPTWSEAVTPSKRSTPKKEGSLIKSVLNSETNKRNSMVLGSPIVMQRTPKTFQRQSSGLEIMTATQIAKTITPGRSEERKTTPPQTASFINIKSTPGKGILKMTPGTGQIAPKRSVVFRLSTNGKSPLAMSPQVTVNRLSEKYFAPPKEEDSTICDSIEMRDCSSTTPNTSKSKRKNKVHRTPIRKSARIANK